MFGGDSASATVTEWCGFDKTKWDCDYLCVCVYHGNVGTSPSCPAGSRSPRAVPASSTYVESCSRYARAYVASSRSARAHVEFLKSSQNLPSIPRTFLFSSCSGKLESWKVLGSFWEVVTFPLLATFSKFARLVSRRDQRTYRTTVISLRVVGGAAMPLCYASCIALVCTLLRERCCRNPLLIPSSRVLQNNRKT